MAIRSVRRLLHRVRRRARPRRRIRVASKVTARHGGLAVPAAVSESLGAAAVSESLAEVTARHGGHDGVLV